MGRFLGLFLTARPPGAVFFYFESTVFVLPAMIVSFHCFKLSWGRMGLGIRKVVGLI